MFDLDFDDWEHMLTPNSSTPSILLGLGKLA